MGERHDSAADSPCLILIIELHAKFGMPLASDAGPTHAIVLDLPKVRSDQPRKIGVIVDTVSEVDVNGMESLGGNPRTLPSRWMILGGGSWALPQQSDFLARNHFIRVAKVAALADPNRRRIKFAILRAHLEIGGE